MLTLSEQSKESNRIGLDMQIYVHTVCAVSASAGLSLLAMRKLQCCKMYGVCVFVV